MPARRANGALAALLPLLASGCATWSAPGAPLRDVDPARGYRLSSAVHPHAGDELLVAASFSGGGMRAAALAHGVLRELAATSLPDGRTLLDELDVISGVSGGAVVAASFALDRERHLRDFESRFLRRNVTRDMFRALLNPVTLVRLMSRRFARGDLYGEVLDRWLFRGATFDALAQRPRAPFVMLNATDLGVGARVEFTQDMFDAICVDLSSYPLARAVAASAAAPPAVTPLALRNHAGRCGYHLPADATPAGTPGEALDLRRELRTRELRAWQQATRYPWLQLADGSIVDDLGVRALTDAMLAFEAETTQDARPIILITVDAAADTGPHLARRRRAPGELETARRAAQVTLERNSTESQLLVRRLLDGLAQRRGESGRRTYLVEVDPRRMADAAEREAVMAAPTTLGLPPALADRIVDAGAQLLREAGEFHRLQSDLAPR